MDLTNRIWKTEANAVFLSPSTVCSSCKRKFVVCPFVDKETNRSYPFANGLNGVAYLCELYRRNFLHSLISICKSLFYYTVSMYISSDPNRIV